MKNRNKTLTSLAAASMVLTQVGQMSVFAKEEPMKNLSDTDVSPKLTTSIMKSIFTLIFRFTRT